MGWGRVFRSQHCLPLQFTDSGKDLIALPPFFKCDKGNTLLPNLVKTLRNTTEAVGVNEQSHESCQVLLLLPSIKPSLH